MLNRGDDSKVEKSLVILDARPLINAMGNAVSSRGGFESTQVYTSVEMVFGAIGNIHDVREAFSSLKNVIITRIYRVRSFNPSTSTTPKSTTPRPTAGTPAIPALLFSNSKKKAASIRDISGETLAPDIVSSRYRKIIRKLRDKNKWFLLNSKVLLCSTQVAKFLTQERASVIVHCSDGWDRTPQICSLAELMLDPYYRTLQGFAVLVEKDWISYGHRFARRCGHSENRDPLDKQRSPVFIQWIDCVFQLLFQFPSAFEFNELFLVDLIDNLYSCRYGTFLFDSEKERDKYQLTTYTTSVWSDMVWNNKYKSKLYEPVNEPIYAEFDMRKITLFLPFTKRWDPELEMMKDTEIMDILRYVIAPDSATSPVSGSVGNSDNSVELDYLFSNSED